jgi:hypothetical protein
MSNVLTINVPHQLSRAEVKRRLDEGLAQGEQQFGTFAAHVSRHWEGDTLHLTLSVAGQTVSGKALVEDRQVHIELVLPWMLGMLAGAVRQGIEQHGRKLLGHQPGPPGS